MENQIKLVEKAHCTGCRACSNACPTSSIKFELNGLHYYPTIDEDTCIRCGKCMGVCSPLQWGIKHPSGIEAKSKYYCAWNKDAAERYAATSGGVGGAMAELALKNGWYVCGAAFDKDWHLSHIVSNDKSIIEQIRGSKYLQSNTDGVYAKIKVLLDEGENVLFIGTPCQTDALNNCVPVRLRENLLLCEIICHGINSPKVWEDYRHHLENYHKSPIAIYNFRSKSYGWGKLRVAYTLANGKEVDVPAYQNIFHHWFGQHFMLRESCLRCQYRTVNRYSDIIIGDFWGIETIEPSLDVKAGASVVITNTPTGESFFVECQMTKKEIESSSALKVIKGFVDKTSEEHKMKEIDRMHKFEEDYASHSFDAMYKQLYPRITPMQKLLNSVLYYLHLKK